MAADDWIDWIPFAIRWEPSGPLVEWCHLGARRFVEPFFDQTIQQRQRDPDYHHSFRTTPAQALHEFQSAHAALSPTGFLFHASRCGSTLVTQMLASAPQNRVLSEPNILDSVLAAPRRDSSTIELLRAIVGALGVSWRPEERSYFIKFSSRAIHAMPLIRRAFPKVPWAFVYREPLEILGAQIRGSGEALAPGLANAGLLEGNPAELDGMRPEEFWTRILASRYRAALEEYQPESALLVNYRELPDAVWESLLPFFGLTCSLEEGDRMRAVARLNAKDSSRSFTDDSALKRSAVSGMARTLVEELVGPHYRQLESLRLERCGR
jgi:hypothetical protein